MVLSTAVNGGQGTRSHIHFVHVQLEHFPGLKGHETAMVESAEEKMIQLCKNITFFDKK